MSLKIRSTTYRQSNFLFLVHISAPPLEAYPIRARAQLHLYIIANAAFNAALKKDLT